MRREKCCARMARRKSSMAIAALLLFFVVVLAVKGISKPFVALLGLVTVLETNPGELYPMLGHLHLERVLGFILLVSFFQHGKTLRMPQMSKCLLAFYGAMLLGIPLSFWVSNSIQGCIWFFETVFYALFLASLLETEVEVRKYLMLLIGLMAWVGGSALYEYHAGVRQFQMGIDRSVGLTSSGGDPDTLALTMVLTIPLALLFLSKENSKWTRLFALGCLAIYVCTIISTGSRTEFFALILLFVMLVFQKKRNLKFLPLLMVALPLFWLVIPQQYKLRYMSVETRNTDESYTDRLLSWQGGIKMFEHNPLTGVGMDNYTYANGMKYWPVKPRHWLNAHSLYFKALGELGLTGTIAFAFYVITLIRLNRTLARRFSEEGASLLLQNFPRYCNLSILLLLFAGYAAHDNYRTQWYTLGAVSGALSLLPSAKASTVEDAAEKDHKALPPWLPKRAVEVISPAEELVS